MTLACSNGGCSVSPEELLVVLAGDGGLHDVHPDGQRGAGAGLFFAERLAAVVADPDAAGDRRREAEEPCIGEVAGGAGLAAQRMLQLRDCSAGAMRGDGAEQRHHGARGLLADDLVDCGRIFPQRDAVGVGDLANQARRDADAVVGKDGIGSHLLLERDFGRAERDGQIGRNVRGDAEAVRHVDDLVNADARGELDRGNVARLGKGVGQGHRAFVVVLVVVRRVAAES